MTSDVKREIERCLAILDAHRHLIAEPLFLRLRNCMANPEHDPRTLGEDAWFSGYVPAALPKKPRRKK